MLVAVNNQVDEPLQRGNQSFVALALPPEHEKQPREIGKAENERFQNFVHVNNCMTARWRCRHTRH